MNRASHHHQSGFAGSSANGLIVGVGGTGAELPSKVAAHLEHGVLIASAGHAAWNGHETGVERCVRPVLIEVGLCTGELPVRDFAERFLYVLAPEARGEI